MALESTRLAAADLASGRLVAPLAGRSRDASYVGHTLVLPRSRPRRLPVRAFVRWLLAELALPDPPDLP